MKTPLPLIRMRFFFTVFVRSSVRVVRIREILEINSVLRNLRCRFHFMVVSNDNQNFSLCNQSILKGGNTLPSNSSCRRENR